MIAGLNASAATDTHVRVDTNALRRNPVAELNRADLDTAVALNTTRVLNPYDFEQRFIFYQLT